MTHPLRHLEPVPKLTLRLDRGEMRLDYLGSGLGALPLTLPAIHSLFDAIDPALLVQGLRLRLSPGSLRTPLGFEALLHVTMINMVHCVFPRVNLTKPLRMRLTIHSLDRETNFVRNLALINQANHIHIAKDRCAGLPMVVALPGPSLDPGLLRQHRDSFVLLAAGRAAGPLIEAGVLPDFIYMQDVNTAAWDINFGFLGERRLPSVLVTNPLGAFYKYAHNFSRIFKAWNYYPFEKDLFPKLEETAPSSASGAYSLARLLGCDPVVFVGNDCGDPVPARTQAEPPGDMTNLPFVREGDDLVFAPLRRETDLYFRFADEFCVSTRNDYVTAAQWLKMRARQDVEASGRKIFDLSRTGLCRFNSVLRDGFRFEGMEPVALPELPRYTTRYDARPVLKGRQSGFSFIVRQLRKGVMPPTVLTPPYSCVLQGTVMAAHDLTEPVGDDVALALANAEIMLGHIEAALGALPSGQG